MSSIAQVPSTVSKASDEIRRAIIRAHAAGIDVGELLVDAVSAADRQIVKRDGYGSVTSNRPGSWEAAIVTQLVTPDWP